MQTDVDSQISIHVLTVLWMHSEYCTGSYLHNKYPSLPRSTLQTNKSIIIHSDLSVFHTLLQHPQVQVFIVVVIVVSLIDPPLH